MRSGHKKCSHAQEQKHQKARKEQKEQLEAQEGTTGDSDRRWNEQINAHHWYVRKDRACNAHSEMPELKPSLVYKLKT